MDLGQLALAAALFLFNDLPVGSTPGMGRPGRNAVSVTVGDRAPHFLTEIRLPA
jgi:hypothetical protein